MKNLTKEQINNSVGRACKVKGVKFADLYAVVFKSLDKCPKELKSAWLLAHEIGRSYRKSNKAAAAA